MNAGGQKARVVFQDSTVHRIPHEEQDELIKSVPSDAVKMVAVEKGHLGDGDNLELEVIRSGGASFVCKVAAQNCVEALDKLRACLQNNKTAAVRATFPKAEGEEKVPQREEPKTPKTPAAKIKLRGLKNLLKGLKGSPKPEG